MSNETENKDDLSPEVNNSTGDKVEDEVTSEDSQDDLKAKSVNEEEQDSANDEDKSQDEAKTTSEKVNDISETKDKKENDLNSEDSEDVKASGDEKEKELEDTENGQIEDEKETKTKVDDAPKKGAKKVASTNKVVEQSDSKKRGSKSKVSESESKDDKEVSTDGKGVQLGEIPRVDASISRFKNDDLKLLYRLLFKAPGKSALIVKSIKKFNGFGFKKDTDEYTKKIESTKKFELKQLKSICEMLDLEKKGTKDEIVERIIDFLIEPKDSVRQTGAGRPKRTAAVRANNRGYSSHDDSYSSDERRASRASGRGKGRRTNLKDETTSESDEEFHLSDSSDTPQPKKRSRPAPKNISEDEDISEAENPTSDESGGDSKKKKAKKVPANDKVKPKATPGRRGRKPAAELEKKPVTPNKRTASRKPAVSEENNDAKDEGSSSEDEPLIKKAKSPQPPTDDEIKKYVKEILDGADLEEITMKTVCKQVYAHYPDFDLSHKKDFIKSTVKSLIST